MINFTTSERVARTIGVVVSGVAIGLSVLAIAGWALESETLVTVAPGAPPMTVNAALAVIGCAVAQLGCLLNRRRLGLAGGVVALIITAATLSEYFFGIDLGIDRFFVANLSIGSSSNLFPGRMAASTAICLFSIAVAWLALTRASRRIAAGLTAGIAGMGVTALAVTTLVSYATGVLGGLRQGYVTGGAIVSMVAIAAMGITMVLVSWDRDVTPTELPPWLPVAVGIGALVATVYVWRGLIIRQEERVELASQRQIEQIERTVTSRVAGLATVIRWLGRSAALASDAAGASDNDPAVLSSVAALAWVDSSGRVEEVVPSTASAAFRRVAREAGLAAAGGHGGPGQLRYWMRDAGEPETFVIGTSSCGIGSCGGAVVASIRARAFFGPVLAGLIDGYGITIFQRGQPLFRSASVAGYGGSPIRAVIGPLEAGWAATLEPGPGALAAAESEVPEFVLGLGLILCILLTLLLRQLQNSWTQARAVERTRLAQAVDSVTDGLWEWNIEAGRIMRSGTLWRRLGYEESEVPTTEVGWRALIHPDDRGAVQAAIELHLSGQIPAYEAEYRIQARTGEWHRIVDRGRVVERDARGGPFLLLGITADITERKRSEEALAASERRFRAMFESGFQYQMLLDLDCRVLEANRSALDFGGVGLDQIRGVKLWDTVWWAGVDERQSRLRAACDDALTGRMAQYQEELQGGRGGRAVVDFSLNPILDGEGRVVQLLAEARDVTERKRVEDALRETDTLSTVGRIAARVAHEINNPLAGIQNSFLLIRDAVPDTHPHFRYVGAIEREIARIANVTRQLYETYRPSQDEGTDVPVRVVISDVVSMLEQVNKTSGVRVEVDLSGTPANTPVPPALLRQAVYNLVQNAVEVSPPGSVVSVSAVVDGRTFSLTVGDRGPGVPVELRERIFEPFFSTKTGTKTAGMGLGLALVRRSVQALGGAVEVRDAPGGGTQFSIQFPISPSTKKPQ